MTQNYQVILWIVVLTNLRGNSTGFRWLKDADFELLLRLQNHIQKWAAHHSFLVLLSPIFLFQFVLLASFAHLTGPWWFCYIPSLTLFLMISPDTFSTTITLPSIIGVPGFNIHFLGYPAVIPTQPAKNQKQGQQDIHMKKN